MTGYGAGIRQEQGQKLLLSHEIVESLQFLQLPLQELRQKIDEIMLENPALEYDEDCPIEPEDFASCSLEPDGESYREEPEPPESVGEDDEFPDPFYRLARASTFKDFLLQQIGETDLDEKVLRICRYLIEDLDRRGFLQSTPSEIAEAVGSAEAEVNRALKAVKALQPCGVGASGVRECLLMQLPRRTDPKQRILQTIIDEHLELVAENRVELLAKRLSIPVGTAGALCKIIRGMNPIPSRGFNTETDAPFVIPEATVAPDGDGRLQIRENGSFLPRVRISESFRQIMADTDDPETLVYLREKMKRAAAVLRGLSERRSTLSRVLEQLTELQPSYFISGPGSLKPMSIAGLAGQLGLHESTVSRAVAGKYILCRCGVVSLRSLFTSGIPDRAGGLVSSEQVRHTIREMVEKEDRSSPLTDRQMEEKLCARGMELSRRTVAKYRAELEIPSAARRRSYINSL
jgi:RNA polymerase sigma-54 factor